MTNLHPDPQQADVECVATCCSNLQVLHLKTLPDNSASALACLPGLTSLTLWAASDQQCSSLAQLTGLRELLVGEASQVSAAGLRQLVGLEQVTRLGLGSLGWSSDVLREQMSDRETGLDKYEYVIINKVGGGWCVCVGGGGGGGGGGGMLLHLHHIGLPLHMM